MIITVHFAVVAQQIKSIFQGSSNINKLTAICELAFVYSKTYLITTYVYLSIHNKASLYITVNLITTIWLCTLINFVHIKM